MQENHIVEDLDPRTLNMMFRWHSMLDRCYNKDNGGYSCYGGRGIKVCKDWLDFFKFLDFWGFPPFENASIGRINNDGNYEPSNCEWQTQEQQNDNTRRNKFITWNGKTQTIKEWAKEYNVGSRRLSERLRRGWTIEKSLTTPCPKGYQVERDDRIERNKKQWAAKGKSYRNNSKKRKKDCNNAGHGVVGSIKLLEKEN